LEKNQLERSDNLHNKKATLDYINEKKCLNDIILNRKSNYMCPHHILLDVSYLSRNNFSLNDTELPIAQKNIEQIQNGKIQDIDLIFLVRLLARYHTQNTSENPPVSG
jgi:hypothetical protein